GHHREYIEHLITYNNFQIISFFCILLYVIYVSHSNEYINIIEIPSSISNNSEKEFNWINSLCQKYNIKQIFFLNLDLYLRKLKYWKKQNISISGIYFHPPHRISITQNSSILTAIMLLLKKIQKYILLKFVERYNVVNSIYILDDRVGAKYLNKKYNYSVKYLPDPIQNESSINFIKEGQSSNEVLLFGSIIPRKNYENLIKEIMRENLTNYNYKIIGHGNQLYVSKIKTLIEANNLPISITNQFVNTREMENLFLNTDIVLMVYKNFFGSSGVLGHSAKFKKPVICAKKGLIEYLVKKYDLGISISSNYKGLKNALEMCSKNTSSKYTKTFIMLKSPTYFTSIIYNSFIIA
ncbi:MAG: glycosyltransferase, partial [Ignavibacteriae bacterium]|nr:glycosyltransferase [Ignavibacteriota bacterium]